MSTVNAHPRTNSIAIPKAGLTAHDIMTPHPVCVTSSMPISELTLLFDDHDISGAPVVDSRGRVVALVSKADLARRCSPSDSTRPSDLMDLFAGSGDDIEVCDVIPESLLCVDDLMAPNPLIVSRNLPAADLARLMFEHRAHRAIVIDDHRLPIGIITSIDLLGAFPRPSRSSPGPS